MTVVDTSTLKQSVFGVLDKYHDLEPLDICHHLQISYKKHGHTIATYKSQWRYQFKIGQGSKVQQKPISFHKARGWVYVNGLSLSREKALLQGWIQSKNRNKVLIWKDPKGIGRMEWHGKSGRVNIFPRQPPPATRGRVYQLFCNGFSMTGLIDSMQVLSVVLESIRLKGATAVWDLGVKVPYFVIDFFKLSNGLILKGGDLSHRTSVEIEFCLPDFEEKAEAQIARNNRFLEQVFKVIEADAKKIEQNTLQIQSFNEFMKDLSQPKKVSPDKDRSMVV